MKPKRTVLRKDHTIGIRVVITMVATSLLIIHLFTRIKLDNISLVLLVLAAIPWLLPFLSTFVKSIEFLGNKIEILQDKADEQEKIILHQKELIEILYEAAQHNLTVFEYNHLKNLESDASGYRFNHFLPDEMVRLCQHGFVEESFPRSTWEMEKKRDNPFNLKEFYRITDKGKEHIRLIERLRAHTT
jgi:hypothetical protein